MNTKAIKVAWWEFSEKVKSKAFILSLIIMPIIIILLGAVPTFLATREDTQPIIVGIIDETNKMYLDLSGRLEQKYKLSNGLPNYILRKIEIRNDLATAFSEANDLLRAGEIEGYFYFSSSVFDSGKVEYRARNVGNIKIQERFSRTIEELIVERRLAKEGLDPSLIGRLTAGINVVSIKVTEEREEETGFLDVFFTGYILIMILVYLILTSGQMLVRSMVEEKSNRLVEVLLSSCSAKDLMAGKILGLSALAVLQVTIWGLVSLAVISKVGFGFNVLLFENLLLSVVYFILGYLFYAAIFVAAGSPVTTEHEAQQITSYLSLLLIFPLVISLVIMQNPNSTLIKILSFIPLITPTLMVLRLNIQLPQTWEIIGTIGVLFVSFLYTIWLAGKIFRVAILSYGKRPSLAELVRWIREE